MKLYFEKNKKLILLVLVSTFIFYFLCNAYGMFNLNLSYDYLRELVLDDWSIAHKVEISRIIDIPYDLFIRGRISTPIIVFIGGFIWLSLSIYVFIKIFNLEDKPLLVILIAGIMSSNYVISDLACTNPQQLDVNMLSLFASILAVYFWRFKKGINRILLVGVCACISYGIYASYIQTTILLIIFISIMDLLDGKSFKECLFDGLYSLLSLAIGVVAYTILVKIALSITNIPAISQRSGFDSMLELKPADIFELIIDTYLHSVYFYIDAYSVENNTLLMGINVIFILISVAIILTRIFKNKIGKLEIVLIILLGLMLPLGTNMVYLATQGNVKTMLARYANAIFAVIPLILLDKYVVINKLKITLNVLICVMLLNNVQFSNTCYIKKDLEDRATLSFLTRVIQTMESDDNYIPGESKVIFVGSTKTMLDKIPGFENLYRVNGQEYPISTTGRKKFESYFKYVLVNPIVIADEEAWDTMQESEEALSLEAYPSKECAKVIDGYYVIRLSD